MDDDKNRDPSSSDPLSEHTAHPEDADFAAWQRFTAEHPSETPPRQRRRLDALGVAAIAILVMTVLGVIALRPTGPVGSTTDASSIGIPTDLHAADIVSVELVDCLNRGEATCESVAFELVEGPDVGAVYTQVFPPSAVNPDFDVGRTAVLARANTNGTVIDIGEVPCPADPSVTCPVITVAVDDVAGPLEYIVGSGEIPPLLEAGDGVIVELFPDSDPPQVLTVYPVDVDLVYQFNGDFERRSLLLWTTILFVVAVVAVGLMRGVAAIGGLVVSVGILLLFVLPAILEGVARCWWRSWVRLPSPSSRCTCLTGSPVSPTSR